MNVSVFVVVSYLKIIFNIIENCVSAIIKLGGQFMSKQLSINVLDYNADNTGKVKATSEIQQAINVGSKQHQPIVIASGIYSVGALFIPSHTHLIFEEGAKLVGTTDLMDFPEIFNRVAGVEMKWPAAVLNILSERDVQISGPGVIDCQGPYWWDLYWGKDQKSGRRADYDSQNLRWIADYDIKRVREILVYKSYDVKISDITLQRSGFWNLQITYCQNVLISNITVQNNDGPSTDGIDIDSSVDVRITESTINCNDDCIVVKSGRDGDGYRVGRPSHHVEIDHCKIYAGDGITIGSEVSGGIFDIYIHDIDFIGTSCGFRIKSSPERGGYIKNIEVKNLNMVNVRFPIKWIMSWHKAYNTKVLGHLVDMPIAWQAVAADIPENQQFTTVQDIKITNINAQLTDDKFESTAFDILAASNNKMTGIRFNNCQIQATDWGKISGVDQLEFDHVLITIHQDREILDTFDNR